MNELKRRHRLRIVVPSFPTFNIFSQFAPKMTALGPVCVATAVKDIPGWDVEIIDENNLGKYGPKLGQGADHAFLQQERPVDVVGFYGGLTSTIPLERG